MREGLAGRRRRPVLDVIHTGTDTGRGVVAKEAIPKGSYVCEYKTSAVYPAREKEKHDKVHECNDGGCYVVETFYSIPKIGKLCFDATERFHHPGRYINHVGRGGNLRFSRPFLIRGKWRIGFIAIRDIRIGEELCYDYLDRDREQRWLKEGQIVDGRVRASAQTNVNPPSTPHVTANPDSSIAPSDVELGEKDDEGSGNPPSPIVPPPMDSNGEEQLGEQVVDSGAAPPITPVVMVERDGDEEQVVDSGAAPPITPVVMVERDGDEEQVVDSGAAPPITPVVMVERDGDEEQVVDSRAAPPITPVVMDRDEEQVVDSGAAPPITPVVMVERDGDEEQVVDSGAAPPITPVVMDRDEEQVVDSGAAPPITPVVMVERDRDEEQEPTMASCADILTAPSDAELGEIDGEEDGEGSGSSPREQVVDSGAAPPITPVVMDRDEEQVVDSGAAPPITPVVMVERDRDEEQEPTMASYADILTAPSDAELGEIDGEEDGEGSGSNFREQVVDSGAAPPIAPVERDRDGEQEPTMADIFTVPSDLEPEEKDGEEDGGNLPTSPGEQVDLVAVPPVVMERDGDDAQEPCTDIFTAPLDVGTDNDTEEEDEIMEQQAPTTEKTKKARKPGKRRYVWCPIQGCLSGPIQKLTQHLRQVHKLAPHKIVRLNRPENRRYATPEAVVSRTPCPPRRQRTLEALLQRYPRPSTSDSAGPSYPRPSTSDSAGPSSSRTSSEVPPPPPSISSSLSSPPSEEIPLLGSKGKGRKGCTESGKKGKSSGQLQGTSTRQMGFHKSDPFLDEFMGYLTSRAGGKRSDSAAAQLCKNISKYLYFLDSEKVRPELLLQKKPLVEYLKVVEEEFGVGSSGLLQKLDTLTVALRFMRFFSVDQDGEEEIEAKCERMMRFVADQRKTYKTEKTRSERVRLEEIAANPPNLTDTAAFLTSPKLTQQFLETAEEILGAPGLTSRAQYCSCLALLAGRLLYR